MATFGPVDISHAQILPVEKNLKSEVLGIRQKYCCNAQPKLFEKKCAKTLASIRPNVRLEPATVASRAQRYTH